MEGFAYCGAFPIHHAWTVDERDCVVDFTWPELPILGSIDRAYQGVVVPIARAFESIWTDGESVLWNLTNRHRSLVEPWLADDRPERPTTDDLAEMLGSVSPDLSIKFGLSS